MKNYFDQFYEVLHKNSIKRRRMISLLLVLSMFVSSGVAWELRGTVVTLVNEPIAEIDAESEDAEKAVSLSNHVHSDECYQDVLICGLEENEEHTHTEECYEKQLVCGFEDDEDVFDLGELSGDAEFIYESEDESEDTESSEESDDEEEVLYGPIEMPALTLNNPVALALEAKTQEEQNAPYVNAVPLTNTVDNIAQGIKFTLFDFGDSTLESEKNKYRWQWSNDQNVWTHPKSESEDQNGWRDTGINTGRDPATDILFFAMGTPVSEYCRNTDAYNERAEDDNEGHQGVIGATVKYIPDKNSYSGDYNATPPYSGNRPVSGIVSKDLGSDGYPKISILDTNGDETNTGNSLAYLFAPSTNVDGVNQSAYKTVYTDVNHLLKSVVNQSTGVEHLVYNSDVNYAYFDEETNNFIVYDRTFPIINPNHHAAGDTDYTHTIDEGENKGDPTVYQTDKDKNFNIGFFPFDEYDPTKRDPNFDGDGYNHHFGMTMEAAFTNLEYDRTNVKEPITFKYSGDDDMWVFVDNQLVLDIGGIHEPAGGMIDFSHGLVWVQDNGALSEGKTLNEVRTQLTDANYSGSDSLYSYINAHAPELINGYDETVNNQTVHRNADYAWDELPKPIAKNTSESSENKWIVKPITDYITDWYSSGNANKDHTIKMFYLERGGCYSNLAMEMNLPTVKPLTVKKDVDYQDYLVKGLYEDYTYWFQIYEGTKENGSDNYTWNEATNLDTAGKTGLTEDRLAKLNTEGLIGLKAGERLDIPNLGQDRNFKIVEIGYSKPDKPNEIIPLDDTYSKVVVNEPILTGTDRLNNGEAGIDGHVMADVNSYNYTNQITQKFTNLNIKKKWDGGVGSAPANFDTVKFRIIRTDSVTGERKQVALQENGRKVRTFALTSDQWENGKTIEGLLSQYGNHYYTYTVEELNAPAGYVASYEYGTDNSGSGSNGVRNAQIDNVSNNNTQIHVAKTWENVPDNQKPEVKLILKRESVAYSASQETSLTINIYDEIGNLIKTQIIPDPNATPPEHIYANGSAEIAYSLPKGVQLYKADRAYPQKQIGNDNATPLAYSLNCSNTDSGHKHDNNCYIENDNNDPNDELYVKFEEDEKILVVNNLNATNNVVSFKVSSEDAEDDLMLVHHSFSRGPSGWETNTGSSTFVENNETKDKVITSGWRSYAKNDGLYVRGRTQSWHGAKLKLDPAKFKANNTYTFSVYVWSPVTDNFKLTFNNGLGGNQPITNPQYKTVTAESWTQLTGTITIDPNIDPYNMYLLIETEPYYQEGQSSQNSDDKPCKSSEFRVDEFVAVEGRREISVSQQTGSGDNYDPGGIVTISGEVTQTSSTNNTEVYNVNFNSVNPLPTDWSKNGNPNLIIDGNVISIRNRSNNSDSIQRNFNNVFVAGHKYKFELGVQREGSDEPAADYVRMVLQHKDNNDNAWKWLCESNIPDDDRWKYVDTTEEWTIPETADMSNVRIYFETNDTNKQRSFRLRYLRIYDVTQTTTTTIATVSETIPGYKIENGKYVSDYSNYTFELDTNSVTNPMKLTGDYALDSSFEEPIELPIKENGNDVWIKHYGKDDLNEESDHLYRYYIAEEQIKINGNWVSIPLGKGVKDVQSGDTDHSYLVSVTGDNVATNTDQTPIRVTNKYIWYQLPATGGIGTDRVYLLGLLLIATGIISGYCLQGRRRRLGEDV